MLKKNIILACIGVVVIWIGVACNSSAANNTDEDGVLTIRLGGGYANEEPLWLLEQANEDLAPNKGKTYMLEVEKYRANADRLSAYQAGQINGGSLGQSATILASSQGIDLTVVAGIAKETPGTGYNTPFYSAKNSGIEEIADLKGKTIGIADFKSPTDFWVRNALRAGGLDPDKDVQFAITPIPAMNEAVLSGKIDLGIFPQPYGAIAEKSGQFNEVFTSKTGVNIDEDFLVLFLDPVFIEENEQSVRDFLADYKAVMDHYIENDKEMRQQLIDSGAVEVDKDTYIHLQDNNRDAYVNEGAWGEILDLMQADGWLGNDVELDKLIDMSLLPE